MIETKLDKGNLHSLAGRSLIHRDLVNYKEIQILVKGSNFVMFSTTRCWKHVMRRQQTRNKLTQSRSWDGKSDWEEWWSHGWKKSSHSHRTVIKASRVCKRSGFSIAEALRNHCISINVVTSIGQGHCRRLRGWTFTTWKKMMRKQMRTSFANRYTYKFFSGRHTASRANEQYGEQPERSQNETQHKLVGLQGI